MEELLNYYASCWLPQPSDGQDTGLIARFQKLLAGPKGYFERDFYCDGHITGSALVVDANLDKVLLTLHAKLGRWLQLGGHADGDQEIHRVAMREASEESGLNTLQFLPYEHILKPSRPTSLSDMPIPFDLDIHLIPARRTEPEHFHYDVRFLIVANAEEPLQITDESSDLRWFTIAEARRLTDEASMLRQFDKISELREILQPRID